MPRRRESPSHSEPPVLGPLGRRPRDAILCVLFLLFLVTLGYLLSFVTSLRSTPSPPALTYSLPSNLLADEAHYDSYQESWLAITAGLSGSWQSAPVPPTPVSTSSRVYTAVAEQTSIPISLFPSPWNPDLACFDMRPHLKQIGLSEAAMAEPADYAQAGKQKVAFRKFPPARVEGPVPVPFESFACLPTRIVVGLAKTGTTAFWAWVRNHPNVPDTGVKEQRFWDHGISQAHHNAAVRELLTYGRRYGYLAWGRFNATPIDISPLYWDRLPLVKELHLLLPEARLLAFIRDPVPRFTSCYKYFCIDEKGSTCSNQELEARVFEVVAKFRECVCGGQLGSSSPSSLSKCQTYQPLRRKSSRVIVEEGEYTDAWPLTDLDLVQAHFERCSALSEWDALYHCGLIEGLYWIRLLHFWSIWGNQLHVVASDRWLSDSKAVFEEIETFFGIPVVDVQPPDYDLNIADAETHPERPSKHTTLSAKAEAFLAQAFQPSNERLAHILHLLNTGRLFTNSSEHIDN